MMAARPLRAAFLFVSLLWVMVSQAVLFQLIANWPASQSSQVSTPRELGAS